MKNFPFEKDGKTFWYSRAIVCLTVAFCRDTHGQLYILANKRGTATNKEVGKWNLPVGFLDFDETCAECAAREVFEETGVKINHKKLKLHSINSKPDSSSQDVSFRYYIKLSGIIDDYPVDTSHQEKNEVAEAKWINLEDLDNYQWGFNHRDIIQKIILSVYE